MNNTIIIDKTFERNKNLKAFIYTCIICVLLFLFCAVAEKQVSNTKKSSFFITGNLVGKIDEIKLCN